MWMTIIRGAIAGLVVIGVTEFSTKSPRFGALLLTLPIVSIVAFVMTWTKTSDMSTISRLAKETLVLVPLGLPFFVPLALADRWGLSFWPAFLAGLLCASVTVGMWFWVGPKV